MTTNQEQSFADTVRALEAKKIQEYKTHRDTERDKLVPPLVEQIKANIMKHIDKSGVPYYRSDIEFSEFGSLDKEQRSDLRKILESPPLNLIVEQDEYDGREFWVISWSQNK